MERLFTMADNVRKKTNELLEELKFKKTDIQEFISNNPNSFIEINLKEFWESMIEQSGMSKSDIINKADYSYAYFYDVIAGRKIPTSDKIVRLILAMHLDLDDCQNALHFCGKSKLYPRLRRDSILIYAITHGYTVMQTQELLIDSNEEELK
jgi:hypothetical protein